MVTPINTLWTILVANIPLQQWFEIDNLYNLVETNFNDFTTDDLAPVTDENNEPTWHRNLRNALQSKRKSGELLYDGNAKYRIDKPYVWRMIKEAVNSFDGQISYSQIREFIANNWDDVNPDTITAQIIILCVNHSSRTHYPENQKPRVAYLNSPHDFLYYIERGIVVKYNPDIHGIWEIYKTDSDICSIRLSNISPSTKIYTPADIIWFKNVTNTIDGEAYLDVMENPFIIHFPTKHKPNVLSPAIDELIIIYQKVNGIAGFTHIVTPIDNELIEDNSKPAYRYGRRVKYIAKTNVDNFVPVSKTLWQRLNFSGITQGNACKLKNIKNIGNIDELQYDIWCNFNGLFSQSDQPSEATTSAILKELETTNPDLSVSEGELKLVSHLVKERNRKIIGEKKQEAIRNNILLCEVCTFSFIATFNKTFIECHHITPIGTAGVRDTTLSDLSLVCPNCHRMLHTKFDGKYLTIDELRTKIGK